MGYITTILNGREVYCCDSCGNAPAKKHRCPYGYCPSCYLCEKCWQELKASGKWKEAHKNCKAGHLAFMAKLQTEQDTLNAGYYVRCSALGFDDLLGVGNRVKVIFRNKERKEIAYWMNGETYNAIELGITATPEDYMQHGDITPALNTNIYSPL